MIKTVGILGLGVFGSSIAQSLGEHHFDVIAVDKDLEDVNRVEQYLVQGVQGKIEDLELLRSIGFEKCDVAVVATGSNLEASVLAIMNCKKLGIDRIIAKAKNRSHMEIMTAMGADDIIRPEKEMGDRVARNIMRNKILDVIDIDDEHSVIEFFPPKEWIDRSLIELDLRNKYGINIIGIKPNKEASIRVQVLPNEKIREENMLVAIGNPEKFEHLDYTDQLR